MAKKILALKITPQTYPVYTSYPGILHHSLSVVNNQVFVRDEALVNGMGYFDMLDFDRHYKWAESPLPFDRFSEVRRQPPLD